MNEQPNNSVAFFIHFAMLNSVKMGGKENEYEIKPSIFRR